MKEAKELQMLILARTGLKSNELVCPREKSDMTPCVCRDGNCAVTDDGKCVGCGIDVITLLKSEKAKHTKLV